MNARKAIVISVVAAALLGLSVLAASAAQDKNPFKLKPGAKGKLCLQCHPNFEEKLKSRFLHTPVKEGDCSSCHSPHASSHGSLLAADPDKICLECHDGIVEKNAVSTHKVVLEGACIKCHDPHGAPNKNNLLASGNELCFGCHKDMKKTTEAAKVKHEPVSEGCLTCHNPHASTSAEFLLNEKVPGLCLECHDSKAKIFGQIHMHYPVEKGRCTSCHDPHGGNAKGILYATAHQPVVNRMCNQCHEPADSANPLATRRQGFELCRACHSTMVNEMFTKNQVHGPVLDQKGCLNCHSPHASRQSALLKAQPLNVCGKCHGDTIERQETAKTKHPPIQAGECTACHSPHASDNPFYFKEKSQFDLCGQCHEWQSHSTHPIGDEVKDPRNQNRTVMCTSCHRVHGNGNEHMFHYAPAGQMCVQCHTKFRR